MDKARTEGVERPTGTASDLPVAVVLDHGRFIVEVAPRQHAVAVVRAIVDDRTAELSAAEARLLGQSLLAAALMIRQADAAEADG